MDTHGRLELGGAWDYRMESDHLLAGGWPVDPVHGRGQLFPIEFKNVRVVMPYINEYRLRSPTRDGKDIIQIVGWVFLALCVIGICAWAITYRRTASARITHLTWMRAQNIERCQTVREDDWDIPGGGRYVDEYRAIHHYDRIPTGSHQQCSGSGKNRSCISITDYTSVPVYRTKYVYDIERWVVVRTPKREGVDTQPFWPDISDLHTSEHLTIGNERPGQRISRYTAEVFAEKKTYSLDMGETQWATFKVGQACTLTLNILGNPTKIESTNNW